MTRRYAAVVGAGACTEPEARIAFEVGRGLASHGFVVVTGGLGGIMEAASRGAGEAEGIVVGLLPGSDRSAANPYVDVALPTGIGELRNALVVRAADVVIAVGGEHGTLSEIAFALKTGVPVIGLGTWDLARGSRDDPIHQATDADDAVALAIRLAR